MTCRTKLWTFNMGCRKRTGGSLIRWIWTFRIRYEGRAVPEPLCALGQEDAAIADQHDKLEENRLFTEPLL